MDLQLNKNFYGIEAINGALEAFKEVCEGSVREENFSFEIELKPLTSSKEVNENLREEFCNYVLGLMNNKSV